MIITRTSHLTGNTNVMELPITQSQLDAWVDGELIQNVMSHLSVDEREFIISGVTPAEQQAAHEAWQVMQDLRDIHRDLTRIHSFAEPISNGDWLSPSIKESMSNIVEACETLIGELV